MKHLTPLAVLCALLLAPCAFAADAPKLPPIEKDAKARLEASSRHGEWVDIAVPGSDKKMKVWVVYPERKDKAPVVIVIQEIFGLTDWIRSVADQLAADGFIAIAPDLLSGPAGEGTEAAGGQQAAVKLVSALKPEMVTPMLNAARDYGIKLPAANGKSACIGFCWGGGTSFRYASEQPDLNAAVVYYGVSPSPAAMEKIKCPVDGHYGGKDARISSGVPATETKMKELNKTYTPHVHEGAGHGFLRQQTGSPENQKAADEAWPDTIKFLTENTKG